MPRGTMMNSPFSTGTRRSRNSIANRPLWTRKSSSSCSCRCQSNGPWNLTSFTCCPFNSPTIFGSQWDVNRENFCDRLTLSMRPPTRTTPGEPSATMGTLLPPGQRLLEVRAEVVGRLDANGHANQLVTDAEARPLLRGESRVRDSGRPHDESMHTAQAGRDERDSEAS